MIGLSRLLIKPLLLTVGLPFIGIFPLYAADLQRFPNAELITNPANDGDSFTVEAGGKSFRLRLYFVDCPETSISSKSDARRAREQTRYFGLSQLARTIHFGNQATALTKRVLSKPFTVYTSFASALGRSAKGRVYGFILTAEGDDLAELLVENGLARTHGVGRKTPDGIPRDEMVARLHDLEISASLKRIGIWSESDPDRIAKSRAEQRSEDQELTELRNQVKKTGPLYGLLDINTASKKGLQSINGIGDVLAERIISSRPYKTIDELVKVKGIGLKTLEKIRPYVVVRK